LRWIVYGFHLRSPTMTTDPTLHQALAARGYRSEPSDSGTGYSRTIIETASGRVVGLFRAHEAWAAMKDGTLPDLTRMPTLDEDLVAYASVESARVRRAVAELRARREVVSPDSVRAALQAVAA
jgi:hypothetical protein